MTRYYAAEGYPPGTWLGTGLNSSLGATEQAGTEVTEQQLRALFEDARSPFGCCRGGFWILIQGSGNHLGTRPVVLRVPSIWATRIWAWLRPTAAGLVSDCDRALGKHIRISVVPSSWLLA
jgi:hypothetical protein